MPNNSSEKTSDKNVDVGNRLKNLRSKLGYTQEELGNLIGVTKTTIQNYEYGRIPKGEHIITLAGLFNCSADWILFGDKNFRDDEAAQAELMMVPKVRARLAAGRSSLETSGEVVGHFAFRFEWIHAKGSPKDMVLMDVAGDSLEPLIRDGDTVLVDQSQSEIIVGKLFAVALDDEVFIKSLHRKPGMLVLRSYNKLYDPIDIDLHDESLNFRVIGRVVWHCGED